MAMSESAPRAAVALKEPARKNPACCVPLRIVGLLLSSVSTGAPGRLDLEVDEGGPIFERGHTSISPLREAGRHWIAFSGYADKRRSPVAGVLWWASYSHARRAGSGSPDPPRAVPEVLTVCAIREF